MTNTEPTSTHSHTAQRRVPLLFESSKQPLYKTETFFEASGQVAVHKLEHFVQWSPIGHLITPAQRAPDLHSLTIFSFKMYASARWCWSVFVYSLMMIFPMSRQWDGNATYFYTVGIHLWSDVCAALSFPTVEGMGDTTERNGLLCFSWFKLPNLSSCTCSFKLPLVSWWFCFSGSMGRGRLSPANCVH